uniref:DUF4283 domain-containing protein n=1 Tax=Quercus lobata TaxID=97700 RepID=A0A7N2MUN9_QUELO
MADEVADSMDRMKLTFEEEEIITISDEGRMEALESCQLSLIGKFLTCKSFNKMDAKNTIQRAWGLDESQQILEVGPNLFQFKFQSEFEMDRVVRGGPWSFDNQLLMLQQWKKGMTVAKEVGSRLGDVEEVKGRKRKDDINFFLRVQVALPITKPLRRGGGENGGSLEYPYGEFLKAVRGHVRVMPNQNTSPKSNPEEGKGNVTINPVVVNQLKTVAVMEESPEISKAVDEGEAVNPGEIISHLEANKEGKDSTEVTKIMIIDKEDNDLPKNLGDAIFLADEGRKNRMSDAVDNHVLLNDLKTPTILEVPGPSFVKPKSTWTRINRMDFGLGGLARAIEISGLGKRELSDGEIGQYKEQRNKRSKQDEVEGSFVDTSAGVNSHPCREQ